MAMIENESIEDASSTCPQNNAKATSDTSQNGQAVDLKLGPDLTLLTNTEPSLANNCFFASFETDFCTKQPNKLCDLIESQHHLNSNLLDLSLFNRLALETNQNLPYADLNQSPEPTCSYCSRTSDSKLLSLDCNMHKICNQCHAISSSSSSRKNSEPGTKLKADFSANTTNSETSGSIESSSVSSSDDNFELRFEQLIGIKCKLCSLMEHDLNMNKLLSSSMSSSPSNSCQLNRMLSTKSNTITDESLFDENMTSTNLSSSQSHNDQIFDLFSNSNSVIDVLKHLSMDQDDFNFSSLNQLTPVNSFQCLNQNYPKPSNTHKNSKQSFTNLVSNFNNLDLMNAPLNLPPYLNNSSSSSSSSTSSASSTSSQTLANQNFNTLVDNWSLNLKNCQSCMEKPESICYCLDCKERLCRNCYLAHQRVRLTKEHRIQFLDMNNNMDSFLLSNHLMPHGSIDAQKNILEKNLSSNNLGCFSSAHTPSSSSNRVPLMTNSPDLSLNQSPSIGVNCLLQQSPISQTGSKLGPTGSNYDQIQLGNQNNLVLQVMSMMNHLKASELDFTPLLNSSLLDFNGSNTGTLITNSSLGSIKCSQHPSEICNLFCNTCQKILCTECSMHLHRQHAKVSLVEAVNEAKLSTENLINESTQIIDVFKDSLTKSIQMVGRIQTKAETVSCEISKTHIQHLKALEQRKKVLLENLEKIQTAKINALNKQIGDIKKVYSNIDESVKEVKTKIKQLPSSQSSLYQEHHIQLLFECKQKLIKEIQTLKQFHSNNYHRLLPLFQPCETDELFFTAPDPALHNAIAQMGFLTSTAYGPNCIAYGDGLAHGLKTKISSFIIQTKDHLGELRCIGGDSVNVLIQGPDNHLYCVDVVDKQNGTYLVNYCPPLDGIYIISVLVNGSHIQSSPFTIQVKSGRSYNNIGKTIFMIDGGGEGNEDGQFCRPWGVCCDSYGNIIIADRSNNRIQIFDSRGKFLRKFGSYGTRAGQFDRPAGVAFDSKLNRIIVTDKDNHRIQVFQHDGTFLFKFGEKGSKPGPYFNYPWDVAVSGESNILISDTRNHRIQLFNLNGQYLNKYGFDGPLWKQFDSPRGVAFNAQNQIIVTDFNNHRLLVINPDFQTAKFLGSEGNGNGQFLRPQGCAVDHEGNIIVADSRNYRIQIFSPNGLFKCKFGTQGTGADQMDRPSGVCITPEGHIPVSYTHLDVYKRQGVCITPEGHILVVDFGNHRVLAF